MLKFIVPALLIAGYATPALADYWVIQNPTTKRCTIVTEKPVASSTVTILDDGTVFKDENEANGYVKKTKICTQE